MNSTLSIGGAEAAGFFKEATGFAAEFEVAELGSDVGASGKRERFDRGIDGASTRGDITSERPVNWLQVVSR